MLDIETRKGASHAWPFWLWLTVNIVMWCVSRCLLPYSGVKNAIIFLFLGNYESEGQVIVSDDTLDKARKIKFLVSQAKPHAGRQLFIIIILGAWPVIPRPLAPM